MTKRKSIKLCIVVTAAMNLHSLYRDQFAYLVNQGFDITAIASPGIEHGWVREQGVKTVEIPMERSAAPLKDLLSLSRLLLFFLFNRFDLISISTPKASFLGALAARLSLHRVVIYMIRGRAHENMVGRKLAFYKALDKITCALASSVQCISKELADIYVKEGTCSPEKMIVLGAGSSNGVNTNKFSPERFSKAEMDALRDEIGIPKDAFIYMYCGRIRKDKGINELVEAFELVQSKLTSEQIVLLIVGQYEDFDPVSDLTRSKLQTNPSIVICDWTRDVEKYFAIADVFVFPSYREGFGNVAIEAGAMQVPVVAFNVMGCRESVEHNVTGFLCEPFSIFELQKYMQLLYSDTSLRLRLGSNGRIRAVSKFDNGVVWRLLAEFYASSVGAKLTVNPEVKN